MANLKKVGTLFTASVLSFSLFSSTANASTTVMEQSEKVQIQVASTELIFTKDDLIKKFHEFFPNQFDYLTTNDFQMGGSHFYADDDALRYGLSFFKTVNGKQIHGNVGFVGENLDIEQFYYQPADESEALFPPKVSKDEAQKTAANFIQSFADGDQYQLDTDTFNYFPRQVLTEPIRYTFSFARTKDQVTVSDQIIMVGVLGNGDIVEFYKNPSTSSSSTFDDVKKVKDKNDSLEKLKENLSVDLQYQVLFDYRTEDRKVELVYQPTTNLRGTHAISGQWITANGYAADFPKTTKTEKLVANPLPPKQNGITLEEAKKVAQQLLKPDSDKVKLNIQSVSEIENMDGQTIISIEYMYEYENGGYGTSLYINKQTGEVTQYSDATAFFNEQNGEKPNLEDSISSREALNQAISYLKEWVPSYLHNYAMPVDEFYFDERQGTYHFSFPRMVNDIVVIGDNISVSIAGDGSLSSLHVNYQEVDQWPSSEKIISEEDATKILKEALSLNLTYVKDEKKESDPHYDLVYLPVFNEKAYSFLNATTGEWNSLYDVESSLTISHPWAEEELNYLVDAKILDIKDNDFNADASVSKGEAIKIIMNSLTYVYSGSFYFGNEEKKQTFENIDPKHPLYPSIERAVEAGIIQQDSKRFDVNAPVKREELAAWYVRVLGLEQAAKHSSIYKLDIADANKVQAEYTGYVALASTMGLLKTEQNLFNPDREVTYAELAVSIIPLAHEMSLKTRGLSY